MNVLDYLSNRRSVRQYTGESIPKEQLDQIIQAGLLSASGRSRKPWELVVVQKQDTLHKLVQARVGAANMLEKAGCAIVVFADPEKTDVWVEDCSIVMSNMHLMADSLGLGSCWIQGRLRETPEGITTEQYCKKLLGVPDNYVLEAMLSIGVCTEHPEAHTLENLEYSKVHYETFGKQEQ